LLRQHDAAMPTRISSPVVFIFLASTRRFHRCANIRVARPLAGSKRNIADQPKFAIALDRTSTLDFAIRHLTHIGNPTEQTLLAMAKAARRN